MSVCVGISAAKQLGMVGAAIALLLVILSHEWWAAIGGALFLAAGLAAYIQGYAVPDTTVEGEIAAAPWRAYRTSVTARVAAGAWTSSWTASSKRVWASSR